MVGRKSLLQAILAWHLKNVCCRDNLGNVVVGLSTRWHSSSSLPFIYSFGHILTEQVCIYVCVYICTYMHEYVYIYIHAHIYSHMHICVYLSNVL